MATASGISSKPEVNLLETDAGLSSTDNEPLWGEFRPSSWTRRDMAAVAQPHGDDDQPCANYWLAWPPYITGDSNDIGHPHKIMRRRFRTKEAAMAYADKTWPPERSNSLASQDQA